MAYAMCLQDWITVSGPTLTVVTQTEAEWLELPGFQDISLYAEVAGVSNAGNTNLDIQASPTKDDAFFGASTSANAYVVRYVLSNTSIGVQTVKVVRWANAADQLPARFLRWRATFPIGGPTNITFRIWVSLNQAGWM